MDHPLHLHDVQFQILDINGRAPAATHAGWKPAGRESRPAGEFVCHNAPD